MVDRAISYLVRRGTFYEGPRWHDGRWWVSDFYRHAVLAISPDGVEEVMLEVEAQPSGMGWMPDGSLLVAAMKSRQLLRRAPDGTVSVHADLKTHCPGHLNDMIVDGAGRAYVGNFGYDVAGGEKRRPTSLVRVDPDGTVSAAADDLSFPNGTIITPDGRTLVVAETMASRLTAFTVQDDGSLTDRRVWAQLGTFREPGTAGAIGPDGCCLDAEGCIWMADAFGRRCVRVADGGEIAEEIQGPGGLGIYACMLGGADGRTLLLCSAPNFGERERINATDAVLLTTEVDVPHAGLP